MKFGIQHLKTFTLKGLSHIHGLYHDHRSGIIRIVSGITVYTPGRHLAWSLAHRHIWGKINVLSRSTRMENDPYHSWKAPCFFRAAAEYIREFHTRRMPVLIRGSRWLHGRNTVPSRSGTIHFSSVYSGWKIAQVWSLSRICRCTKDHVGCLPSV